MTELFKDASRSYNPCFPPTSLTKLLACHYSGLVSKREKVQFLTKTCLFYLRLLLRVLRELVMLDDFSLILSGPVAHPDPSKVACALTQKRGKKN